MMSKMRWHLTGDECKTSYCAEYTQGIIIHVARNDDGTWWAFAHSGDEFISIMDHGTRLVAKAAAIHMAKELRKEQANAEAE